MQNNRISLVLAMLSCWLATIFAIWLIYERLDDSLSEKTASNAALIRAELEKFKEEQKALAPPSATNSDAEGLSSIFQASTPDAADAAKINALKTNFESLFVSYQYLLKCKMADDMDYHLLNSALMHQMSSLNAPGRLQYDILTAAKGTYDEIYARSLCDGPDVQHIQQEFRNYLNEIKKNRFLM